MSNSIDLFILAFVSVGLATPYDLKAKAGLSLGSTIPTLQRLEKAELISADDPGPRRMRRFRITKKGQRKLNSEWRDLLNSGPASIEEIMRIMCIARVQGDRSLVRRFIQDASANLASAAKLKQAQADQLKRELDTVQDGLASSASASWYRWTRLRLQAVELEMQSEFVAKLAKEALASNRKRMLL